MSKVKGLLKILEVAFKFCKKCVTMTPHDNNVCRLCKSGSK